jgi:hypothetical protein
MKPARDAGIDAGRRRALDLRFVGSDREGRVYVRAQVDRLFRRDWRRLDRFGRGDPNVGKILREETRAQQRAERNRRNAKGDKQRGCSLADD